MSRYYDPVKTIVKGVLDFLKVLLGGGAAIVFVDALSESASALPATWDGLIEKWPLLAASLVVGLAKAGMNFYKHGNKPTDKFRAYLPVLLLCVLLAGCVTSSTREQSVDADGASYDFRYRATSAAAPFGKVDATVHNMAYQGSGTDGGSLTVGQDAVGMDNTAQVEAVQAAGQIVAQVMAAIIQQGGIGGLGGVVGGGNDAGAIGGLAARLQALEQSIAAIQLLMAQLQSLRTVP